jgi:TonB family protein
MASAELALPGVIQSAPTSTDSQGSGTGGGAGTGSGTGVGSGQGSGLGPGYGGGTGGGAYRPGAGITLPVVLREVKPAYTADAMRAKVQGSVWLECIVMPDGSVGEVKVTRSLDPIFGLDQEAIKAAKLWKFRPGMRQGEPVPVIITIELTFTLR